MKTIKLTLVSLLITLTCALPAFAVPRVFVSGLGNDANPGSITSPKRSFTSALTVTDAGGEIVVLDSAGYGPVTISQSVSIIAPPGVYAGITASSGQAITVNIATSDVVVLRGLTINSTGGSIGVLVNSAGTVHVENCVMNGHGNGAGLYIVDSAASSSAQTFVKDSIFRGYFVGIQVSGGSASLDHIRMEQNSGGGLIVQNTGGPSAPRASIANSVASDNQPGFSVGRSAELSIEACLIANNHRAGVDAEFGAVARVSNSVVTNNEVGLLNSSSTIKSRGNNTVDGNGTDTSGAITALPGI
jgi:parallel beta helix pectate lyase-like protein